MGITTTNGTAWAVRIEDEDGHVETCGVDEFLEANPECFGDGEEDRFAAGEPVTIGGGAAPLTVVQLVQA